MQEKKFLQLIGKRIAHFRKVAGMTQQALADECDMERSAIGRLELGTENVTAATLLKLSKALNISISEFFNSGFD